MDPVREHLRLLSIFHYVVGGLGYLVSLFPIIHLAVGISFLVMPERMPGVPPSPPPSEALERAEPVESAEPGPGAVPQMEDVFPMRLFGLMFTVIPAIMIVMGFVLSTLIIIAGRRLAAYRSHTYCLAMAGIECLFMPFGTVLGVFTILTLIKPEARHLFGLPPMGAGGTPSGPFQQS